MKLRKILHPVKNISFISFSILTIFILSSCSGRIESTKKNNFKTHPELSWINSLSNNVVVCTPVGEDLKGAKRISLLKAKAEIAKQKRIQVNNTLTMKNRNGDKEFHSSSIHTSAEFIDRREGEILKDGLFDINGVQNYCIMLKGNEY